MNIQTHCLKVLEDSSYDLNVVHFLIGSKSSPNRPGFPIHEFPRLARNLFVCPENMLDANALSYIEGSKIKLRQVLYLIDSEYSSSNPEVAIAALKELRKTDNVSDRITSSISMFVHDKDIICDEMDVLISIFKNRRNYLINIQDTTSIDMCRKHDSGAKIHRLPSDCFLNTSEDYACPMITYEGSFRWINMIQDSHKLKDPFELDSVIRYLNSSSEFIFCKFELVALVRLWNLHDMNEDVFTILGEKIKLSQITNKNYSRYYKFIIFPYVTYRCAGNAVEDHIVKFIDNWNKEFSYVPDSIPEKTFLDIVIEECLFRTNILGEKFSTARDICNMILRRHPST